MWIRSSGGCYRRSPCGKKSDKVTEKGQDPGTRADQGVSPCHRVIFLVGLRGTGKTTVARLLAERLGWQWADADTVLESRHGRSIRQIFAEEGETGFRDKEAALLEELCDRQRHVLATGGGVVLRPENCRRLRAAGLVIWLTADPATLWDRLQHDETTAERRPDLTVGGLAEIEEMLRLRRPLYEAVADLTVDTAGRSPAQVVEAILKLIPKKGTQRP
jgi:shikimate kinase